MSVPPLAERPTWAECHERGMSLRDACTARVTTSASGRKWARDNGVEWSRVSEPVERVRLGKISPAACRHIAARMRA